MQTTHLNPGHEQIKLNYKIQVLTLVWFICAQWTSNARLCGAAMYSTLRKRQIYSLVRNMQINHRDVS